MADYTVAALLNTYASHLVEGTWGPPRLAPSIFAEDMNLPAPGTAVPETIPGSEGGLIEAVKRAVVMGLREALTRTSITVAAARSRALSSSVAMARG